MRAVPNAKSYKTREAAEKKIARVLGDEMDEWTWMVIAQADGRYTPAVLLRGEEIDAAGGLLQAGLAVLG